MPAYSIENPLHAPTVHEFAPLDEPLEMICQACGSSGRYSVGRLVFHPELFEVGRRGWGFWKKTPKEEKVFDFDAHVSFSGYVLCDSCGAGGPWHYPEASCFAFLRLLAEAGSRPSKDMPFVVGEIRLFDGTLVRNSVESERHLLRLLDDKPDCAFLWNRLGNTYDSAGLADKALAAFQKAIDLEPRDIESMHSMAEIDFSVRRDPRRAVEFCHRIIAAAHHGVFHNPKMKRTLIETTLETVAEFTFESKGKTPLLPTEFLSVKPETFAAQINEHFVRKLDLSTHAGIDRLIDFVLMSPDERAKKCCELIAPADSATNPRATTYHAKFGRNSPCPCGSGKKHKHCCGRM